MGVPTTKKNDEMIAFAKTLKHTPWCDDYEKMISDMVYNTQVEELLEGRFRARKLMHEYNNHFPSDATHTSITKDRQEILERLMGHIGKGAFIEPPISIDYGCNISIGENFYSNFNLVIVDSGIVKIGDRCQFGPFISIFAAEHPLDPQPRREGVEWTYPVVVGDDCWIGGNVTILAGVTIGKGCTIGANSLVTRDIPDYSVAYGSPAKVVKKVEPPTES